MTVEEIIEHEGRSGHLCLMLQGMFMRAYNGSAQTLARLTGYRLKRHSLWSEERPVCYCGFPFAQLERVSALITDAGGILVSRGNGYAEFSGLDVSFDASAALSLPLREPRRKKAAMPADGGELARRIAAFDLARATPLEAMNFVGELQRQLFAAEVND
ncbi:hypothetical protein [Alistipes finegoldii]|uniref:hypothetical protein n=1 Tax=Alistipes finegoldii TaxID=214856 RepID=UPI00242B159A|nr:hypothetical protein [Alistipes finegoldii]